MPTQAPPSSPSSIPLAFPALYLYSITDAFVKHINLANNQHVKIGRQTNVQNVPAENNGYFDLPFLDRLHAEVWAEDGRIFIKDTGSSNGTFINSERLSLARFESKPYELKPNDIVEFGSNLASKNNRALLHDRIVVRVACVLSEQEAVCAASNRFLWGLSNPSSPHFSTLTPLASETTMPLPVASYIQSQHATSPRPLIAATKPRCGSQAERHIQERCTPEQEAHASLPTLMRAVKRFATLVAPITASTGCTVWSLDVFDKILKGHTEVTVPEPEELISLLECFLPSAEE
jgi:hypothetical protein